MSPRTAFPVLVGANPEIAILVFKKAENEIVDEPIALAVSGKIGAIKATQATTTRSHPNVAASVFQQVENLRLRQPFANRIIAKIVLLRKNGRNGQ